MRAETSMTAHGLEELADAVILWELLPTPGQDMACV